MHDRHPCHRVASVRQRDSCDDLGTTDKISATHASSEKLQFGTNTTARSNSSPPVTEKLAPAENDEEFKVISPAVGGHPELVPPSIVQLPARILGLFVLLVLFCGKNCHQCVVDGVLWCLCRMRKCHTRKPDFIASSDSVRGLCFRSSNGAMWKVRGCSGGHQIVDACSWRNKEFVQDTSAIVTNTSLSLLGPPNPHILL